MKRQGDEFYAKGDYRSALFAYKQGGLENTKDKELQLKIGVCLYENNDVDAALRMFQSLINEGKTDPVVYMHAAKCFQAKNLFAEANVHYKLFLQKSNPSDPLRPWVKDELIRCANGSRLMYGEELAYVENAGTTINTPFEEFGVRTSPTTIDKIYFNSDREDVARAKLPNGNVDIYSTNLVNGRWATPTPLPAHINSIGYDEVTGFSSNGQILYFLTASGKNFVIKTDTFSSEEGHPLSGIFSGPFLTSHGGSDLIFFNDTICLFSSDRPGGYGGYDLYISIFTDGSWSKPSNLGPSINTFYHERYPFLTRDGMTLFYSSNNLQSIGGYDVFMSTFNKDALGWGHPVNPGFPVNSSLDDTYLVLSPDGMTAYLTSNRKDGHGEEDIYRVFFKQPITAHQQISAVPTFYQLQLLALNNNIQPTKPVEEPIEIKEYYISHLFLDANADILTPQNNKKLDQLANLLLIYPKITAELSCFELPTGQKTFNLYFSIKKTEKAAEYLAGKGIPRSRLLLKGYGSSFPLVAKPASNNISPLYQKLNQRLEIALHDYENEPVIIDIENIKVPENLQDPKGVKFSTLSNQLFYSVQIASISQILQNQAIESVEELFIEVENSTGNYLYMAGMLPTFKEAEKLMSSLIDLGFPDAHIIPYIDGIRIPQGSISDFAKKYPDLLFFLAGKKK
ncbi:MAG TPA: tetratricopeptide repeat protein [Saprospiraceae bacterium]|nr:tetratricopeptide repeat protein [Saprospiraceae bacterium]